MSSRKKFYANSRRDFSRIFIDGIFIFLLKICFKNCYYFMRRIREEYFSWDVRFVAFVFARNIETNYYFHPFLSFVGKRRGLIESKLYPMDRYQIRYVQIFVSFRSFFFPPRTEMQSRFPAESTEIIKSISGLRNAPIGRMVFTGG